MRIKYLIVGLVFSIMLNVLLFKSIEDRKIECGRIHTDDIDRSKNVIPNEKAAIKIAELRLDKEVMSKFGLNEEFEYDIKVVYDEVLDEWCVSFKNKNVNILDGGATIWLSGYYGIMNDFRR